MVTCSFATGVPEDHKVRHDHRVDYFVSELNEMEKELIEAQLTSCFISEHIKYQEEQAQNISNKAATVKSLIKESEWQV